MENTLSMPPESSTIETSSISPELSDTVKKSQEMLGRLLQKLPDIADKPDPDYGIDDASANES